MTIKVKTGKKVENILDQKSADKAEQDHIHMGNSMGN